MINKNKINRAKKIFFSAYFWALQNPIIFAGTCELLASYKISK
tara:strand:+ start:375 stop:503 length:129 start_codon:yes stop_codon:yes gene_type:complete